jgi:hypothetical protein
MTRMAHMIEATTEDGLVFQHVRNLLFVYALLYGTRFLGSARVAWASRGTRAGSAGVTAGRGSAARTCGALFHGAVLHCAFGRARSNIALARRTRRWLGGLCEGGGCCESEDAS